LQALRTIWAATPAGGHHSGQDNVEEMVDTFVAPGTDCCQAAINSPLSVVGSKQRAEQTVDVTFQEEMKLSKASV
jgi:hypothetical protein